MSLKTKKKLNKNTYHWVFDDTGRQIRETQRVKRMGRIAKSKPGQKKNNNATIENVFLC